MARRSSQLVLPIRTWGGKRKGSGRKPVGARAGVRHAPRAVFTRAFPVHVTLRVTERVWNLRSRRSFRVFEQCLLAAHGRFGVQVVEYSVQGNHMHLLIEAPSSLALSQAMKGLSVRLARGMNRLMAGRAAGEGRAALGEQAARRAPRRTPRRTPRPAARRVMADRYHARVLRTPTEVKHCIHYLRNNRRKHARELGEILSARWVDRFASQAAHAAARAAEHANLRPRPRPRTWLVRRALADEAPDGVPLRG